MGDSKIQWTDKTWNPIRARNTLTGEVGWFCEHVSPGCGDKTGGGCYAEKMNVNTYFGNGLPYKASSLSNLELFLDEKILQQPLRWRAPKKVFVCSMTDLFGRFVETEWIDKMFAVMALATQHTFQILTKRPDRMRDYVLETQTILGGNLIRRAINEIPATLGDRRGALELPLFNVWLGTSCENQETADKRIPQLLATPAHRRFVSYEPALGPLNLLNADEDGLRGGLRGALHQVIIGGESGPRARPFDVMWARKAVQDCRLGGIAPFVKQLGAWPTAIVRHAALDARWVIEATGQLRMVLKDKKGGDWDEWPKDLADLKVREYPT